MFTKKSTRTQNRSKKTRTSLRNKRKAILKVIKRKVKKLRRVKFIKLGLLSNYIGVFKFIQVD